MKRCHLQREPNLRPNFKYVATKPKKVGLLNISAKQLDQQFINILIQVAVDFKLIREIDAQSVSYIPGRRLIDFRKASPPFSKEMDMKSIAQKEMNYDQGCGVACRELAAAQSSSIWCFVVKKAF